MSSFNAVESDQTAPRNLQISAAIANQPPPHSPRSATTATSGATNIATTATGIVKSNAASNTKEAKLPPSPLVTPPMNPSQAAPYQAISPRSLDPAAATVPTAGKPSSPPPPNLHQQHQQQQQHAHPGAKGVPHVYHDYSKLSGPGPAYIRKKTGGVTQPFPDKLHEMLCKESSDDPASAIVSWLPHGRAFIVRKPKEFTSAIMPKYFRQTKLTSFQRQLNLYGFRRITQGADSGAYYHPLFLQGRPSLSQRMVRQKVKGTGHKQPSDASSEPNFYTMPPVEPETPNVNISLYNGGSTPTWGLTTVSGATTATNARYQPTTMPPLQPALATHNGTTTSSGTAVHMINGMDPNSPGLSSLQDAAQLLRGISSGSRGGAFLGAPALSGTSSQGNGGSGGDTRRFSTTSQHTPASFLNTSQLNHTEV